MSWSKVTCHKVTYDFAHRSVATNKLIPPDFCAKRTRDFIACAFDLNIFDETPQNLYNYTKKSANFPSNLHKLLKFSHFSYSHSKYIIGIAGWMCHLCVTLRALCRFLAPAPRRWLCSGALQWGFAETLPPRRSGAGGIRKRLRFTFICYAPRVLPCIYIRNNFRYGRTFLY